MGSFEKAIYYYDEILKISPTVSRQIHSLHSDTWYNKAVIESLRNNKKKCLEFLKKAIELDEQNRSKAKTDEAFENVRKSKEFKKIVGD